MATSRDIQAVVLRRDIDALLSILFVPNEPVLRPSFCTETELWEFKSDCPRAQREHDNAWAHIAKDVLAFHNREGGGLIIFGIDDSYRFVGATTRLDSKLFNDKIRKFLGDKIWIDYYRTFIQEDQRYIGIAVVPGRGPALERFVSDAPDTNGRRLFSLGDLALREKDSSRILEKGEADRVAAEIYVPRIGHLYSVDEPMYRIISPDYQQFVEREKCCSIAEKALRSQRTSVTSIIGIGGVGENCACHLGCNARVSPKRV